MLRTSIRMASLAFASLALVLQASGQPVEKQPAQKSTIVEGKIIRVEGKDQVVLRTTQDKEVTVYASPQTVYQINEKGGTFTDLKPDANVAVWYDVRDNRWNATRVVALTQVEGEVVRVVGKDQVIVRTPQSKEVTVYVQPHTVYQLTPQGGGAFTDLRPGSSVNIYYNVQDQQYRAHRIWLPRRK